VVGSLSQPTASHAIIYLVAGQRPIFELSNRCPTGMLVASSTLLSLSVHHQLSAIAAVKIPFADRYQYMLYF